VRSVRRGPSPRAATRALAALLVVAGLAALGGCSRQPPKFIPRGADSTAAVAADSLGVLVGNTLDQWESQGGTAAAPATIRILLDDLRHHADEGLAERARTFLDSCGFSAEVAGTGMVTAVNFFARSDPTGSSWPYLIWRQKDALRHQALEGSGMRLLDLTTPGAGADTAAGGGEPLTVAAIFGRQGSRGQQPVAVVWRRAPTANAWSLAQTLGPDSLGGVGVADFVPQPDQGLGLEARTYRSTSGFDECPTCPHVFRTLRFAWQPPGGFAKVSDQAVASPYYSFVQFVAALTVGDDDMAGRFLADRSLLQSAKDFDWGHAKGSWRVAPGSAESAEEMTFFRGSREAYKVRFALRSGEWVITDIQPTQRRVE